MLSRLSLAHYLKKIHSDDHKKLIQKRFGIILNKLHFDDYKADRIPDLDECLRYLGLATVRGNMIFQTNTLIQDICGQYSVLRPWSKELFELKEHNDKMIELLNKMIKYYLFQHKGN